MEITNEIIIERLQNLKEENAKEHTEIKFENIKMLDAILEQTKKTNGTVADLVRWKYTILGMGAILSSIIIPVILAIIIQFVLVNLF